MSPTSWGDLVLVLLIATGLSSLAAWHRTATRVWTPVVVVLLAAAAAAAAFPDPVLILNSGEHTLLVAVAGVVAISGGGPVTARIFALVDGPRDAGSVVSAGALLMGGAWIGALERAAVFASLAAGWPEGVAIALAVKGLGRYPELRNQESTGVAERFIIGTFTSVLWAAVAAGIASLVG